MWRNADSASVDLLKCVENKQMFISMMIIEEIVKKLQTSNCQFFLRKSQFRHYFKFNQIRSLQWPSAITLETQFSTISDTFHSAAHCFPSAQWHLYASRHSKTFSWTKGWAHFWLIHVILDTEPFYTVVAGASKTKPILADTTTVKKLIFLSNFSLKMKFAACSENTSLNEGLIEGLIESLKTLKVDTLAVL